MANDCQAFHLIISGKVQGVGYRNWAVRMAQTRNLVGWVRNCADGNVEIMVSGPIAAVQSFIQLCHRGPPVAVVEQVKLQELPKETEFGLNFERR